LEGKKGRRMEGRETGEGKVEERREEEGRGEVGKGRSPSKNPGYDPSST